MFYLILSMFIPSRFHTSRKYGSCTFCLWVLPEDNIVTRSNIRVRYRNCLLSFHLPSKFRWGQYFYVKVFQNFYLFCWRINVMVWSRENCVQMNKPEFKVYNWDFSAEKSHFYTLNSGLYICTQFSLDQTITWIRKQNS